MVRPALAALALLIALAPVLAAAQDPVYTWVDGNGVRHYSQTAPEGVRYEVRGVRDRNVGTTATEAPAARPGATPPPQEQAFCDRAKLTLDQLASGNALQMDKDGDGQGEPMTDADRAEQQRLAEQAVRAYCAPAQ